MASEAEGFQRLFITFLFLPLGLRSEYIGADTSEGRWISDEIISAVAPSDGRDIVKSDRIMSGGTSRIS
jgi:hypothetical protein